MIIEILRCACLFPLVSVISQCKLKARLIRRCLGCQQPLFKCHEK